MSVNAPSSIASSIGTVDPIWTTLRNEAQHVVEREPSLAGFVYSHILNHARLEDAVAHRICARLDGQALDGSVIRSVFDEMWESDRGFSVALRADLVAVYDR